MDKAKWRAFVTTLTTNELERHSEDILSFAKECQQIISAELNGRRGAGHKNDFSANTAFRSAPQNNPISHDGKGYDDADMLDPDEYEVGTDSVELDFYTITRIQQAVPNMDKGELTARIEELDKMMSGKLTEMEYAAAVFEKEMCEYQLMQINGIEEEIDENINCASCGATLQPTAAFCPKCGTRQGA